MLLKLEENISIFIEIIFLSFPTEILKRILKKNILQMALWHFVTLNFWIENFPFHLGK